jgi:hypothetical protein
MLPTQAINENLSAESRTRPVIAAVSVLCLLMLLTLGVLYTLAKSQATQQVEAQAERLANSVETLVTPLMISDDRVSLNFIINQLVDDPSLRGIRLTDTQALALAVAGEPAELKLTREIRPNDEFLGELTLWIDPLPTLSLLKSQLIYVGLALCIALLISALVYRYTPSSSTEAEDEADFDDELAQHFMPEPESENESEMPTDNLAEEVETGSREASTFVDSDYDADDEESTEDSDAPLSFDDLAQANEKIEPSFAGLEPEPEPAFEEGDEPLDVSATLKVPAMDSVPVIKSRLPETDSDDDSVDLVGLLRPEQNSAAMPKFKPSQIQPLSDSEEPESEELEISIPVPMNRPSSSKKLPIINEEQLDLYSLEQELDLILSPDNAGYLILIDTTSAHSPNLDSEELAQIRRTYRTLANSVARIYFGKVEALGDDLLIRFEIPKSDDSHGVNALCAALLFNILSRSYNQSRSKQNLALLNVQIAVVRGQLDRFGHMLDEARFLTRSTKSNAVISHTALSEAPELKSSLLTQADVRREDEDKVLINSIERRHQALLEKQARYLLAKLADRANQRARSAPEQ